MNIYSVTTDIGDLNEHLKKLSSIDLTSYATKDDLTNNYYNKNQTDERIDQKIEAAIGEGTSDLTAYVSKAELNDMSYVSTDGLNEMGYIQSDSLSEYAKKSDLTSYATTSSLDEYAKKSDLTPYATTSSLDEYAKKSDLTPYATTSSLGEYAKKSDLTSYATTDSLNDYAKKSDLTPYATTESLGEYAKKSDLTPYATTSSLGEYAKKSDLTPYATKQDVQDAIDDIDIPKVDLTNYYTKDEVYNKAEVAGEIAKAVSGGTIDLSQYVKKTELNGMSYVSASALNGMSYVSASALNGMSYVTTSDLDSKGYVTTSALNDMNFAKATDLNNKQDKLSNANVLNGITSTKVSNWDSASSNSHTHSNKSVLDDITSDDITNWNGKTSNVGTITGIKMNGTSKGTSGVVDLGTVLTSETEPLFTASAAHGITAQNITNWNSKTDNIGTVTGIKINADTFNPDNTGIVDITNSYNSLWTSYQALWNQVTYLYAHVVWKSDEGGDEPTPEPTGNTYVGFIDTEDINEIDVANLTDVTTTAVSTKDDKTSDGITFTCNTGTGGFAWVVVPESYNIQYVYDKVTAETFGDENAVRIFDYIGTKGGNKYWMAGHNGGGYNDGQTFNIVLLTSL